MEKFPVQGLLVKALNLNIYCLCRTERGRRSALPFDEQQQTVNKGLLFLFYKYEALQQPPTDSSTLSVGHTSMGAFSLQNEAGECCLITQ